MSSDEKQRGRGRGITTDNEPSTSSGKRLREESNGGDSKRHAPENRRGGPDRRRDLTVLIRTRPHENPTSHNPSALGPRAESVKLEANYFALKSRTACNQWKIYKYHVTFDPECMMKRMQIFLVAQHKKDIGGFLFDGAQLFTTRNLHGENKSVKFVSETRDQTVYTVGMTFTKIVMMSEQESLQVLNLIQRRNMIGLHLERVGRNYYDPQNMVDLNRFRIQLWPGYETSVRYHDSGILLNCDIVHKVMRTDTVYELMREIQRSNPQNFSNTFRQKVVGLTVLTSYNNKTYRIDDVDFDITPLSTFSRKNVDVTIKQYYSEKYHIEIRDDSQPLLISQPRAKDLRGGEQKPAWLVPELCRITGLDDRQRTDMNMKMALRPYAQMEPRLRRQRLLDFYNRIQSSEDNKKIKEEWGLQIQPDLVQINAYCLKAETLTFGDKKELQVNRASWERDTGRGPYTIYSPQTLTRWMVACPQSIEREMQRFVNRLREFAAKMKFPIKEPRWCMYDSDSEMVRAIDQMASNGPKFILFGMSTDSRRNSDSYSAIKKKCFADNAILCQVVTKFILGSQPNKYDSVVTKVAIQICCKLGGAPWRPRVPIKTAMTVSFHLAKDTVNKNVSYACLVATTGVEDEVSFFSTVSKIEGPDCSRELTTSFIKALNFYENKHETLPSIIFFYRDGVSEGEIPYVFNIQLNHLTETLAKRYEAKSMEFKMAYILVSKRINTRFFQSNGSAVNNPSPGTVVDNTVTLEERYEFFLVSQSCNQGTVAPTNYHVIYDTTGLTPERMQAWTFIQTHVYYNWYGTTRIPATLQYANKLGFLISNHVHRVPNENLSDKLYFL
ncbi:protein piwi-like [Sitodiplosis mosellana]|uniref:protein piwi-like n=1 Tax=Sitodiplosis mosellana TaxID=263140 RepID=UPI00244411D2|nr:protein piwi-like [Sitodiplosis mosellana]XP_055301773.1 protein piwi-like [Sitodiplosis mosellana]XP_055301774.1 protein piwi-like [Sitodiplosis mosellana]XP_055301775.1 protein piwi-like [Sitodiplosis mosellana]XP_055301776.1 protein piwi-like [Sitodiplosis mosellana]